MAFVAIVVGVACAFLGILVVGSAGSMLTSGGATALVVGLVAGLLLCVLVPFLVDRKLTRAFRRLQPGATGTFFQTLAVVNGAWLAGLLLLAPRFVRSALEQRGARLIAGHASGAWLLGVQISLLFAQASKPPTALNITIADLPREDGSHGQLVFHFKR